MNNMDSENRINEDFDRINKELKKASYIQKIRILQDLCRKYAHKSDENFLHYGQLLLLTLRSKDITPEICDICNAVSNILQSKSNYFKALAYAKDTVEYCEKIGYPEGLAKAYYNISIIQTILSNYQEALDAAFNALRLNEHLGDKAGVSHCNNRIGIINSQIQRFDVALEYFERSLTQKEALDDHKGMTKAYQNISLIYKNLKDFDKSLEYGEKALINYQKHGDQAGISYAYNNLGTICLEMNDTKKAIEFLNKSLVLKEELGDPLRISNSLLNIGICYSQMQDYNRAISHFERAMKIVKEINSKDSISNLALYLAKCYENLDDFKQAYHYFQIFSETKDEIMNEEKQKAITEIQTKYETEKKDKENELYRLRNVELATANATKDKFFSIISHDLRSPFATIHSYINLIRKNIQTYEKKDILNLTDELDKSVKSTLVLLQNLLSWSKLHTNELKFTPQEITLSHLLNQVIKTLSFDINQKQLSVESWISDKLIISTDKDMLQTILRNLLSNAIKFSYSHGKIIFNVRESDDSIEITIKDSGTGMSRGKVSELFKIGSRTSKPGTANEKGSGLGLILCREFAEKCGGSIFVESVENKGSVFTLSIPKDKK